MNFIKKIFGGSGSAQDEKKAVYSTETVKQYYEDWTQRYIESFGDTFQSRRMDDMGKLMDYYIDSIKLKPGMRIVDAGSGICGPAIMLAQRIDITIDAVTLSAEQAKIAKQKVAEAGLSNKITVHTGDFHNLDSMFEKDSYDGVIFMESFVHSDNTQRAVDAAVRIVKPQTGFVYIKDLYHGTARNEEDAKNIQTVVDNASKYIAMNIKKLHEVVAAFEKNPVTFNYIKELGFEQEIEIANAFIARNAIPLNENTNAEVFFLKFLDYYELKVTKLGYLPTT
jgi:cyclopropane fatty-acyl-phospholipid synthase-like methyltransferase